MVKSVVLIFVFVVVHLVGGSVLSKKGQCPIVEESDHNCNRQIISECLVDFDCNVTAKCCRTACHQYKCIEPGDVKKRTCHSVSDIAFVLDASGSIGKDAFEKSKNVVKKIIKTFPVEKGYRHAAVVYGKKPSIEFNFITPSKNRIKTPELLKRVDEIPYYKSTITRIDTAFRLVEKKIFPGHKNPKDKSKIIVIFSDGIQNVPPYKEGLEGIGKGLEKKNVKVFAVMNGKASNINALLELCSDDRLLFKDEFLSEMIKMMSFEMEYLC